MFTYGRPDPTRMELNLAPMVDVVMCLIIFFMLASKLVERESFPIDLPAAASAAAADRRELGRRVVLNVVRAGSDQARIVIEQEPVELGDALARLEAERRRDPTVTCVIRGDRDVSYRHIETVVLAAARAGIRNVVFAAARVADAEGS